MSSRPYRFLPLAMLGLMVMVLVAGCHKPAPKSADDSYEVVKAAMERHDYTEALAQADAAIERYPDHMGLRFLRGITRHLMGQRAKAVDDYNQVLVLLQAKVGHNRHPLAANVHLFRAKALFEDQHWQAAVESLIKAAAHFPTDMRLADYLAWALATVPEKPLRNPHRSQAIAKQLCEQSGWRVASYMDTLAAAQAAAGRFDDAVVTLDRAIALTTDEKRRAVYRSRLALYQAGKPYMAGRPDVGDAHGE